MTEHNSFQYWLDDEPKTTSEHVLTACQVLTNAGLNSEIYYLVQIIGHEQKSYRNNPEEKIHMHEHMKFISVFIGETTVSEPLWD